MTDDAVVIRPAGSRGVTRVDGRESRHSFSYGAYYDPEQIGFGLLRACNEDRIPPGGGFDDHPHQGVEIVTWVLAGEVTHTGPDGPARPTGPGVVQVMSAGVGVVHAERNLSDTDDLHLVQMWIAPATPGGAPSYRRRDLAGALARGGWVAAAVPPRQPAATLWVARPAAGSRLQVPAAAYVHVFVARGQVRLAGRVLGPGDAARLVGGGPRPLAVAVSAEVLVWAMR